MLTHQEGKPTMKVDSAVHEPFVHLAPTPVRAGSAANGDSPGAAGEPGHDAGGDAGAPRNPTRKPRREIGYQFRHPEVDDGTAIWELVKETGVLDINSAYSYIMLGEYFSDTCLIAEHKGNMVGFVSGFIPQQQPDTLFIWQVAVAGSERGRGLARTLLMKILNQPSCAGLNYLECTVTPSNKPSTRLFRGIARELGTELRIKEGFEGELFPEDGHEGERLFQIGPFDLQTDNQQGGNQRSPT